MLTSVLRNDEAVGHVPRHRRLLFRTIELFVIPKHTLRTFNVGIMFLSLVCMRILGLAEMRQ